MVASPGSGCDCPYVEQHHWEEGWEVVENGLHPFTPSPRQPPQGPLLPLHILFKLEKLNRLYFPGNGKRLKKNVSKS